MQYNWQQSDWPAFRYNLLGMQDLLLDIREQSAYLSGQLSALSGGLAEETITQTMAAEAMHTAAIEGELLNRADVVSS
ncbi:MAG: DUF4172 domain-containing protein, partial [Bacteroidota bacterium]